MVSRHASSDPTFILTYSSNRQPGSFPECGFCPQGGFPTTGFDAPVVRVVIICFIIYLHTLYGPSGAWSWP